MNKAETVSVDDRLLGKTKQAVDVDLYYENSIKVVVFEIATNSPDSFLVNL